jgi:hypothetical protein
MRARAKPLDRLRPRGGTREKRQRATAGAGYLVRCGPRKSPARLTAGYPGQSERPVYRRRED